MTPTLDLTNNETQVGVKHRRVLVMDSHRLSAYQRCQRLYFYNYLESIHVTTEKKAFRKGSWVSRILHVWNYWKLKDRPLNKIEMFLFQVTVSSKKSGLAPEDAVILAGKLMLYFSKNRLNNYKVIATECGFSRILFENSEVVFVYEGRPDLVTMLNTGELVVTDFKTWSVNTNIYEFNNQVRGYCWGLDTPHFVYDFIGLIKDNDKAFIKKSYTFTKDQLEDWKQETIQWMWCILQDNSYLRSWMCRDIYGLCEYHKLCEQPNENIREWIKKRDFVHLKPYRSW